MLHHLDVRGFKSLRDVHVDLGRLVVVFGPNAAGKSNLLEALVLLSRLVQERTLTDAFQEGIRGYPNEAFSFGPGGVEEFLARERARLSFDAALGPEQGAVLDYRVTVGIRPRAGELSLEDEFLQPLTTGGKPRGRAAIERVDVEGEPRLRIRRKGRAAHPFEEPPGLNHTLASNLQYSGENYAAFDELRREVGAWRAVYLEPREVMRDPQPPREVEDIGQRGEHLVPFLYRLQQDEVHSKAFRAIVRTTRTVIPSIEDLQLRLDESRGEIDLRVKQDGTWMSARVVSEGTLRVLALCAMAANPFSKGLIAFEEPENGVHPQRIRIVARILTAAARSRQVVVTTHSPLVVGEVVQLLRTDLPPDFARLIVCSATPDGSRFAQFDPQGPLFDDEEIRQALSAEDDAAKVQAMLERGWLNG